MINIDGNFAIDYYRQFIYKSPHDINEIRRLQNKLKTEGFNIPEVFCGYCNEDGQMEIHPDSERNRIALDLYNKDY